MKCEMFYEIWSKETGSNTTEMKQELMEYAYTSTAQKWLTNWYELIEVEWRTYSSVN